MIDWIKIEDRCPKEGQVVLFGIDNCVLGRGEFGYFQIGPLPRIPCFKIGNDWIAADEWSLEEKEE